MIKLPSYFTGFSSKSDGSASLRFATQELSSADFAVLKENHNAFGWLVFKENITDLDIPEENAADDEEVTPSERLRKRMFVFWKEKKLGGDFELWRRQQLESIGEKYLNKLD